MAPGDGSVQPRRGEIVEHDENSTALWLREHRIRIALWIAVIEGLLVAVHVINRWVSIGIAAAAVAVYFLAGRSSTSATARQVSWIAATSQAAVVLIPILLVIVGAFALIAVAIVAVLALVALLSERPA